MSTELRSFTSGIALTRFFGGKDRGTCIQVTHAKGDKFGHNIQLTREQAHELAHDLMDFANQVEQESE